MYVSIRHQVFFISIAELKENKFVCNIIHFKVRIEEKSSKVQKSVKKSAKHLLSAYSFPGLLFLLGLTILNIKMHKTR